MILQALKEYYDRKAADPESGIAPPGWERKELPFLITLAKDGSPVGIEDTREPDGKKLRAKPFLVPQAVKRTRREMANLLWDDPEYALGMNIKDSPDKAAKKHALFIQRIEEEHGLDTIPDVVSLITFLNNPNKLEMLSKVASEGFEELKKASFISFKIAGHSEPIFRVPEVINQINTNRNTTKEDTIFCMVSGKQDAIATLHPAIKGVLGANTTGGNIVSFNAAAFCSFDKQQGNNAPVGETTAFAYTTALNTLLAKDSRQKMQVGDATTVFWADKATQMEESFIDFWAEPPKDDPDRLASAVRALFESVETGAFVATENNTRFHVLGLAPNAARIAIRFWHTSTIPELARNIRAYFEDLRIVHGPRDQEDLSLWRLLVSTAVQGKTENINPNLAGQVMRSILEGLPFPAALLQAAVIRIKAERDVSYPRAKLVKGCLNRKSRTQPNPQERMLTMSLDKENTNVGYCLGRLFAVLEKIQQEANPGINATIRDKFYAAASSAPSTVFGNLMRLKNYNLSKLESTGRRIWFEKLIGEIVDKVSTFPAHLKLDDQGRFAIGYYHQVQDLWTKKTDKTPSV